MGTAMDGRCNGRSSICAKRGPEEIDRNWKRNAEISRGYIGSGIPDSYSNCLRWQKPSIRHYRPDGISQRTIMERPIVREPVQPNVFIDSYYPVVFDGGSEDNESRSQNATEDWSYNDLIIRNETDAFGLSTESGTDCRSVRNYFDYPQVDDNPREKGQFRGQNRMVRRRKSSKLNVNSEDFEVNLPSSKSAITIDSKTYTVYSCASNADNKSGKEQSGRNRCRKKSKGFGPVDSPAHDFGHKTKERKRQSDNTEKLTNVETSCQALSAVDCFTLLYKRIEVLEDHLQKTLERAAEAKKKQKSKKKTKTSSEKIKEVQIFSKAWVTDETPGSEEPTTQDGVCEAATSDTEQELQKIKKRIKVLERKLRESKRDNSRSANNDSSSINNSIIFIDEYLKEEKNFKSKRRLKKSKCTNPHKPESFRFCESFYSKIQDEGTEFCCHENSEGKSSNKKNEDKTGFLTKCKKIRRKCSSIFSGSKLSSKSKNECDEIMYKHSVITEKSVDRTFRCYSFPTQANLDVNNAQSLTRVVFLRRSQNESSAEPLGGKKRPKRKHRMARNLCKKNSKTNIHLLPGQKISPKQISSSKSRTNEKKRLGSGDCQIKSGEKVSEIPEELSPEAPENEKAAESEVELCGDEGVPDPDPTCLKPHPLWMPLGRGCCAHGPFQGFDFLEWKNLNPEYILPQMEKSPPSFSSSSPPPRKTSRNPLEILKRGGKIKIPVLFEEVCKPPKEKEVANKASNVSMRFLLVEDNKNPLSPLRKLIKKLSQSHSAKRSEQYVFGVSKCCCENTQMLNLSIKEKNIFKKLATG